MFIYIFIVSSVKGKVYSNFTRSVIQTSHDFDKLTITLCTYIQGYINETNLIE